MTLMNAADKSVTSSLLRNRASSFGQSSAEKINYSDSKQMMLSRGSLDQINDLQVRGVSFCT